MLRYIAAFECSYRKPNDVYAGFMNGAAKYTHPNTDIMYMLESMNKWRVFVRELLKFASKFDVDGFL